MDDRPGSFRKSRTCENLIPKPDPRNCEIRKTEDFGKEGAHITHQILNTLTVIKDFSNSAHFFNFACGDSVHFRNTLQLFPGDHPNDIGRDDIKKSFSPSNLT